MGSRIQKRLMNNAYKLEFFVDRPAWERRKKRKTERGATAKKGEGNRGGR